MKLTIPNDQLRNINHALLKAGVNEIGGQIYGEQIAPSCFRATDVTIQNRSGTFARFFVDLIQAAADAANFFRKTNHDYKKYNYIGEWHSHPSFAVQPSSVDIDTMRALVSDHGFSGNFAVLMICKIGDEVLELGGWVFTPTGSWAPVSLEFENG